MVAMIGGEVDKVVVPVPAAIPQVRAGKVRALAVLSEQLASLVRSETARYAKLIKSLGLRLN